MQSIQHLGVGTIIPSTAVEKLKQKARKLKRSTGTPHHKALDLVAQESGFNHWHHVAESAKNFEPSEQAYYFGLVIAMDIKDAQEFSDESGRFIEDDLMFSLCYDDLYQDFCHSVDEDGVAMHKKYAEERLTEIVQDDLINYVFFRYTGSDIPNNVESVIDTVRECSFWPPQLVWLRGEMFDSYDVQALDGDRNVMGIRVRL